ncbi:MAG: hypothetical protein J6Y02_04720 [Pseudobutyrivibrio sp.]|nr:hypothetical protein [Pseudobutyrivibrio sp.]
MSEKWRAELLGLQHDIRSLVAADSTLKQKNRRSSKPLKEVNHLLKLTDNINKQSSISDQDVMDILNSIVALSQITTSQTLINIVQRRADYFWDLHAGFLKLRAIK